MDLLIGHFDETRKFCYSGTVKAYPQFPLTSVLLPWDNYIGEWCSLLLLEEGCQLSGKHLPEKVALLPANGGKKTT